MLVAVNLNQPVQLSFASTHLSANVIPNKVWYVSSMIKGGDGNIFGCF